jgi:hypothetical protein
MTDFEERAALASCGGPDIFTHPKSLNSLCIKIWRGFYIAYKMDTLYLFGGLGILEAIVVLSGGREDVS